MKPAPVRRPKVGRVLTSKGLRGDSRLRGVPLISATAANSLGFGLARDSSDEGLARTAGRLATVDWGTALASS